MHFDKTVGVCTACPELAMTVGLPIGVAAAALLLAGLIAAIYLNPPRQLRDSVIALHRLVRKVEGLQLMPRVKLLIAFCICRDSNHTVFTLTR